MLRQLLHDLRKVDRGEEVAPREIGQHVDLLFVRIAVRKRCRARDCPARRGRHVVVTTWGAALRLRVL